MNADAARIFKALGDENRLEILNLIRDREICATDILKNVSIGQSTLSHHMKILCESGIVNCRRSGKQTYYSISYDGTMQVCTFISAFAPAEKQTSQDKRVMDVVLL